MTKKTKPKHKLFFLRSLQLLNWKLVHVYNCHCDLTCWDTSQTLCLVQRTQFDHRFINKWMLPLKKNTLPRENKIDQSESWGYGQRIDAIQVNPPFLFLDQALQAG